MKKLKPYNARAARHSHIVTRHSGDQSLCQPTTGLVYIILLTSRRGFSVADSELYHTSGVRMHVQRSEAKDGGN